MPWLLKSKEKMKFFKDFETILKLNDSYNISSQSARMNVLVKKNQSGLNWIALILISDPEMRWV